MDFRKRSIEINLAVAALLVVSSSQVSVLAQSVVLPGEVPIAGSSTRGLPMPDLGAPAPVMGVSQEMMARREQLQQRLQNIDLPTAPRLPELVVPGITANTPVAYGGFKGLGAIGVAYQDRTRYANNSDGVAGLVLSFGNPETVGVDLALNALDLSSNNGGSFGHRSSLSVKLHRPLKNNWAVAVGAEDFVATHRTIDQKRSFFGVVTKQIDLKKDERASFNRLHLSLGIGSGRFQSEKKVFADDNGIGVFGSAALKVNRYLRPFAEWTGQDLNLGASIVPFKNVPIIITPAFVDVTNRAGDGSRFTLGAAYRFGY